jgi:hypothetical protein
MQLSGEAHMDALLPHKVSYDVAGHIQVSVIAESLIANGSLAVEAAFLLEALIPGFVVERAEVSVRRVSHESPLQQSFVVAIVAAFQPDMVRDVPLIFKDLTGVEVPHRYDTILTVVVMMIAVYGISKAIERLFPARKTDKIDENFRNLTIVAGDLIQVPPGEVEAVVRGRLADKKQAKLGRDIRNFFAPTVGKEGALIMGGGSEISSPALAQIPNFSTAEAESDSETTESAFENNQRIIIHAMDRDRGKVGWAGHIPALFEERVPMKLDKTIDPEALFTKTEVIGDVLIQYDIADDGKKIPSEFHLLRIGEGAPKPKRKKAIAK